MDSCLHKNTEIKPVEYKFENLSTDVNLPVCQDCGAEIWGSTQRKEVVAWLKSFENLRIERVRYNNQLVEKWAAFFGVNPTDIVKACVVVYCSKIINNEELLQIALKAKRHLEHDKDLNIRVSSMLSRKIKGLASLFEMPKNAFCSVAVDTVLSMIELDSEIRSEVETVVLAA